jgi:hypothetical protein
MHKHLPQQDPPKFTQIGIFGLKKMPSGNPAHGALLKTVNFGENRPFYDMHQRKRTF